MNMIEAVISVFYKYFSFEGRAVRSEYWYFYLFTWIVSLLLIIPDAMLAGMTLEDYLQSSDGGKLTVGWSIFTVIPFFTVAVRRLHDIGKSGGWVLIPFTIIGIIPFILWMCQKGDRDVNRFGPSLNKWIRKT